MEAKDIIYLVATVGALLLGIWNFVQNYRLTRKTSFINTVTAQRVQWLEQIRQDVAKFIGLTHHWARSDLKGSDIENDILREIDQLRYVIRLRLNLNDAPDRKIAGLVERIPDLTHETKRDELFKAIDNLTTATQEILKAEWEKVKKEAKDGDIKKTVA